MGCRQSRSEGSLDEVIVFTLLEHDGRKDACANVNSLEMETIRDYLDEHLEEEVKPTVGIITPFREQQQFLTRELFKSANAPRYEDELKLKIMTFDTARARSATSSTTRWWPRPRRTS
jgi:hypothetical protein